MDIILVNIPIDSTKKPYDDAFPFSKTINFGILAIASHLANENYQVLLFDPQVSKTNNPLDELCSLIRSEKPAIVGLSCISGFGYATFKDFAHKLKREFPEVMIIGGGQHHIGLLAKTVLKECSAVDIIVKGEGEQIVLELLRSLKSGDGFGHIPNIVYRDPSGVLIETSASDLLNLNNIPKLNHSLYPDFQRFPPVIEVSRGCPYKCAFCSSIRKTILEKNITSIVEEVEHIVSIYQSESISIYFEAPVFLLNSNQIAELTQLRTEKHLSFTWRADTRVEYLTTERIQSLFTSGMRVVDVGLESGSKEILVRMNKTKNPTNYLQLVNSALTTIRQLSMIAKLNILFYLGENALTLGETYNFLETNKSNVQALSAYPLLMYPGSYLFFTQDEISKYGGSIVATPEWNNRHLNPINPSPYFTYDELQDVGIILGKSYQNMRTFFMQKSQGYFSPGTTYQEFEEYVQKRDIDQFPFSRNRKEMLQARQRLSKIIGSKSRTN